MPSWTIVHGAGRAGMGQALGQFQQAREFEAEAQRREGEYQSNLRLAAIQAAMAEQQLGMNEQRLNLEQRKVGVEEGQLALAKQQAAAGNALDFAEFLRGNFYEGKRFGLLEREVRLREEAAQREKDERDRRLEELDREVDQDEALQLFNVLRGNGVQLEQLRGGLEVAGQMLGGGIGKGLRLVHTMLPREAEVFKRLAPKDQERFLLDQAEERSRQQAEAWREQTVELVDYLTRNGVMAPEQQEELTTALGEAQTPQEVRAVAEQAMAVQRSFVARTARELRRGFMLGRLDRKLMKLDEAEVSPTVIAALQNVRAELAGDPNPVWPRYDQQVAAVLGEQVGNVEAEIPMSTWEKGPTAPSEAGGGAVPGGAPPRPAASMTGGSPPPVTADGQPIPMPTSERAELRPEEVKEMLKGGGITELPDEGQPDREEAARIIEVGEARAREIAAKYYQTEYLEDPYRTGDPIKDLARPAGALLPSQEEAKAAGVPIKLVERLMQEMGKEHLRREMAQDIAKRAKTQLKGVSPNTPDAEIVTELVRQKLVKDREMGREVVAQMRASGW
jgi:hypothetical protein